MRMLVLCVALVSTIDGNTCAGEILVFPTSFEEGKIVFRPFSIAEFYGKRDETIQDSTLKVAADVKILNAKLISVEGPKTEVIGPDRGDKRSFAVAVAVRTKLAEKRAIEDMTNHGNAIGTPMVVVLVTEGDTVKEIRVIDSLQELLKKK